MKARFQKTVGDGRCAASAFSVAPAASARARRSAFAAAVLLTVLVLGSSATTEPQSVSFIARRDFAAGSVPNSVAVGDFNGDGVQDLAVANAGSNNISVLLGNGDGTFQAARSFAAGHGPVSVAVGDFNSDGKPDLAVANEFSNDVTVLINNTPVSERRSNGKR